MIQKPDIIIIIKKHKSKPITNIEPVPMQLIEKSIKPLKPSVENTTKKRKEHKTLLEKSKLWDIYINRKIIQGVDYVIQY